MNSSSVLATLVLIIVALAPPTIEAQNGTELQAPLGPQSVPVIYQPTVVPVTNEALVAALERNLERAPLLAIETPDAVATSAPAIEPTAIATTLASENIAQPTTVKPEVTTLNNVGSSSEVYTVESSTMPPESTNPTTIGNGPEQYVDSTATTTEHPAIEGDAATGAPLEESSREPLELSTTTLAPTAASELLATTETSLVPTELEGTTGPPSEQVSSSDQVGQSATEPQSELATTTTVTNMETTTTVSDLNSATATSPVPEPKGQLVTLVPLTLSSSKLSANQPPEAVTTTTPSTNIQQAESTTQVKAAPAPTGGLLTTSSPELNVTSTPSVSSAAVAMTTEAPLATTSVSTTTQASVLNSSLPSVNSTDVKVANSTTVVVSNQTAIPLETLEAIIRHPWLPNYETDEVHKVSREEVVYKNMTVKGKFSLANCGRYKLVHYIWQPNGTVAIGPVEDLGAAKNVSSLNMSGSTAAGELNHFLPNHKLQPSRFQPTPNLVAHRPQFPSLQEQFSYPLKKLILSKLPHPMTLQGLLAQRN